MSSQDEYSLYDSLLPWAMSESKLAKYGYPVRDPNNPNLRMVPLDKTGQSIRSHNDRKYKCERCGSDYEMNYYGMPEYVNCVYHPFKSPFGDPYNCCGGSSSSTGCKTNQYHVHKDPLHPYFYEGFVETLAKPERDPNRHGIYAIDCEMSYTTCGLELTQVTILNHKEELVYEKLVKPSNPVLDYNTYFTGLKESDFYYVTTTLADVQADLLRMFSSKTILIGHDLGHDMKVLKMFHSKFIDTAELYPHRRGLPYKKALKTLAKDILGQTIQANSQHHSSKEDARTALRIALSKL